MVGVSRVTRSVASAAAIAVAYLVLGFGLSVLTELRFGGLGWPWRATLAIIVPAFAVAFCGALGAPYCKRRTFIVVGAACAIVASVAFRAAWSIHPLFGVDALLRWHVAAVAFGGALSWTLHPLLSADRSHDRSGKWMAAAMFALAAAVAGSMFVAQELGFGGNATPAATSGCGLTNNGTALGWQVEDSPGHCVSDGTWTTWHDNHRQHIQGAFDRGARTGVWTFWQANGVSSRQGSYRPEERWRNHDYGDEFGRRTSDSGGLGDGSFYRGPMLISPPTNPGAMGLWQYAYESGNHRARGEFREGERDGLWQFWFDNGNLQCEGTYAEGKAHGVWLYYDMAGTKVAEADFVGAATKRCWLATEAIKLACPGAQPYRKSCEF